MEHGNSHDSRVSANREETMATFSKLLLSFCLLTGNAFAAVSLDALTGQTAPGLTNVTFSSLSGAPVNSSGVILFGAGLSDGTSGIFEISQGQQSLVAFSGQSIAGLPGQSLGPLGPGGINDSGAIAFVAGVRSAQGVFVAANGLISEALAVTTPIPGTGGQTISLIRNLCFNNTGEIALLVELTGNGGIGFVTVSNGVVAFIPNAAESLSLNNAGDIAFLGSDGNIYLYSAGVTQMIAQSGQPVPNTSLVLSTLTSPVLNDQEEIAFINGTTTLMFPGGKSYIPNAIIQWNAGILQKIAANGDPVPGIAGATFFGNFNEPATDNTGRIFFVSQISSTGSNGIFSYINGNLTLLVQEGQVLAGVGTLAFIGEPDANSGLLTFVSNLGNGTSGIFQLSYLTQIFLPDVADGASGNAGAWRTAIILSNLNSSAPASASVYFTQEDGTPMTVGIQAVTNSQFNFTVPPSGVIKIETTGVER